MTTSGYVWTETFAARAARPHDVKGRLDAVGSSAATSVRHADDRLGHQEAANARSEELLKFYSENWPTLNSPDNPVV